VWGKQGFLHRDLVNWTVKPMVSSLVSVEDTSCVVSDIMDSNGCSGVNGDGFESFWVFTKGISVGVLRRTRISPQGLDYPACQAYGLFFTIR
jgi:hypothetical protein